jgi:hypothetical protein
MSRQQIRQIGVSILRLVAYLRGIIIGQIGDRLKHSNFLMQQLHKGSHNIYYRTQAGGIPGVYCLHGALGATPPGVCTPPHPAGGAEAIPTHNFSLKTEVSGWLLAV